MLANITKSSFTPKNYIFLKSFITFSNLFCAYIAIITVHETMLHYVIVFLENPFCGKKIMYTLYSGSYQLVVYMLDKTSKKSNGWRF